MKKKTLIFTSIGALFLVGVSAVALSGTNQLSILQVKADPTEYSVTFNESNTSSEVVDVYGQKFIVFTTTTDNGNKVGVVGCHIGEESFTFNDIPFWI